MLRRHTTGHATLAAQADTLLAPRGGVSETVRADHKDRMLREARKAFATLPDGTGSRDGIEVDTHTATVTHPLFPEGLRMADVEPIDATRAGDVAERVAEAIIEHVYET